MLSKRPSGLIRLSTLECLRMAQHTPLIRKSRNLRTLRIHERKTNCSIFHRNSSKSIWYHSKLKRTFQRQHFCTAFSKKVTVQLSRQATMFRKCTLQWFVEKQKQISSSHSKGLASNSIKHLDLQARTFSTTTPPQVAHIATSLQVAAQTPHRKPTSTMKWKDQSASSWIRVPKEWLKQLWIKTLEVPIGRQLWICLNQSPPIRRKLLFCNLKEYRWAIVKRQIKGCIRLSQLVITASHHLISSKPSTRSIFS